MYSHPPTSPPPSGQNATFGMKMERQKNKTKLRSDGRQQPESGGGRHIKEEKFLRELRGDEEEGKPPSNTLASFASNSPSTEAGWNDIPYTINTSPAPLLAECGCVFAWFMQWGAWTVIPHNEATAASPVDYMLLTSCSTMEQCGSGDDAQNKQYKIRFCVFQAIQRSNIDWELITEEQRCTHNGREVEANKHEG